MIRKKVVIVADTMERAMGKAIHTTMRYMQRYPPAGYDTSATISISAECLILMLERLESCD